MEYKKFRVKSAIKTFRDLEVYKQTTWLSAEIFRLKLPAKLQNKRKIKEEINKLYEISKQVPRLIAESYGDKFDSFGGAMIKLEKAMRMISVIIAKLDFLTASTDNAQIKDECSGFLKKYQYQRVKILNLKKAWIRVFAPGQIRQIRAGIVQGKLKSTITPRPESPYLSTRKLKKAEVKKNGINSRDCMFESATGRETEL